MDIDALYDREISYYAGRPVVMVLPEANPAIELPVDISIVKTDTGVKTSITAVYTPGTTRTIGEIRVINKPAGVPLVYQATFSSPTVATFTTAPQFTVGQRVTLGTGTTAYEVTAISGNSVTFERVVSDLLTYVAQGVSEEVTYQWQILNGSTWSDIVGATDRTYEPTTLDVGKDLRVLVTYVDGRGTVGETVTTPVIPVGTYQVYPVYPVIAELELDIERSYTANTVNKLVVEIDHI